MNKGTMTRAARDVMGIIRAYDRKARNRGQVAADGTTSIWPTQQRLATEAGVSLRSAAAAIKALEAEGYIQRKRRGRGHSNIMRVAPVGMMFDAMGAIVMRAVEALPIISGAGAAAARTVEAKQTTSAAGAAAAKTEEDVARTVEALLINHVEGAAAAHTMEAQAAPKATEARSVESMQRSCIQHAKEAEAEAEAARTAKIAFLDVQNLHTDNTHKRYMCSSPNNHSIYHGNRTDRQTRRTRPTAEDVAAADQQRAENTGYLLASLKHNTVKRGLKYGNCTMEQLEREAHISMVEFMEEPKYEQAFNLMVDMMTRPHTIGGNVVTPDYAKAAFGRLTMLNVMDAVENVARQMFTEIRNPIAYMGRALLNAALA